MIENYMFDRVCDYVDNEITYIKSKEECTSLSKGEMMDLLSLENMSSEEKMQIAQKVVEDYDLYQKVNELIHYYLYH